MPNNITDADVWTNPVQSQADGESVNSTNELIPHQGVADRARYLYNRSLAAKGGDIYVPLTAFQRFMTAVQEWWFNDDSTAIAQFGLLQKVIDTTTPKEWLWWEIPRANLGCKIGSVRALYHGSGGPAGVHVGLPAVLPRLRLLRIDHAAGDTAVVATATAAPGSVGAYEAWQTLDLASLSEAFDINKSYLLEWRGEGGANAVNNSLLLAQLRVTIAPVL